MGIFDRMNDETDRTQSREGYGATGSWGEPPASPRGATGSWGQDTAGEVYDPDAGAMVPKADIGGAISSAFGGLRGGAQSVLSSMAETTGTGYQAPPSITVDPSATVPRIDATPMSRLAAAPQVSGTMSEYTPGPLESAASSGPFATAPAPQPQPRSPGYNRAPALEVQLSNLMDQNAQNRGFAQQTQNINAAQAGFDAQQARRAADVAMWRATNGADMILGSPGLYKEQRQAILANAMSAVGRANTLEGEAAKARGELGKPMPSAIDDFAKGQDVVNRAQLTQQQGQANAIDLLLKQGKLDEAKQLLTLRTQLMSETDPKKQRALADKIAAFEGKVIPRDKIAIIDADTGQRDMMNQPIFKKVGINTETGEILSASPQQQGQAREFASDAEAHAAAKKAIAAGLSTAEANKRLKAGGYAELK